MFSPGNVVQLPGTLQMSLWHIWFRQIKVLNCRNYTLHLTSEGQCIKKIGHDSLKTLQQICLKRQIEHRSNNIFIKNFYLF